MDATCTIQDNIHVFSLVHKYVSSILGTYHIVHKPSLFYIDEILNRSVFFCFFNIYSKILDMTGQQE